MPKYLKQLLFCTVFMTGAAVLIFEVAAVRALSPFFGSSIYVVSSVLTVILAALSLGYYVGGRLADQHPDIRILYLIIASGGFFMILLYTMSVYFFPIAGQLFPVTYGPLIVSIFFFFFPAFLLGIDSPFAIKLLTTTNTSEHNGAVVGSTFFWSTLGSIVGSLTSGFLLIPFTGLKLTFVGTAVTLSLFACAAYLMLIPYTKRLQPDIEATKILFITLATAGLAVTILRAEPPSSNTGTLLHQSDGYYSQIEIREKTISPTITVRSLHREVNNSSIIVLGTTTLPFEYTQFARTYPYLKPDANTFLMIGGGAYTIPRTLLAEDKDLQIDVVEIEPRLFELSRTYFELPDSPRLTNYSLDARSFLNTTTKQYDVIFVDAFNSGHFIPPHLSTQEFFASIKQHLTPDGVFIINIIALNDQDTPTLTGSLLKTIQSVFKKPSMYVAQPRENTTHNLVLIAKGDGSPAILPPEFTIQTSDNIAVPAPERKRDLAAYDLNRQLLLTDDKAPVELLLAKQILHD